MPYTNKLKLLFCITLMIFQQIFVRGYVIHLCDIVIPQNLQQMKDSTNFHVVLQSVTSFCKCGFQVRLKIAEISPPLLKEEI